jgi:UDP-2,3-diacylglucosamine pyrophosphatase LpxH
LTGINDTASYLSFSDLFRISRRSWWLLLIITISINKFWRHVAYLVRSKYLTVHGQEFRPHKKTFTKLTTVTRETYIQNVIKNSHGNSIEVWKIFSNFLEKIITVIPVQLLQYKVTSLLNFKEVISLTYIPWSMRSWI